MRPRIQLEYFTRNDYDQLIGWVSDERSLINWTGSMFSFPLNHNSLDWYMENSNIPGKSEVLIYKAVDAATGDVVGHISLGGFSQKNRSGRISRVLVGNTAQRGLGICQSMVKEITRIGFEDLNLHRISLGVFSYNEAAIRCYQKAGFTIEGVTRDTLRYKEEWWSMMDMGILEDEWREMVNIPRSFGT